MGDLFCVCVQSELKQTQQAHSENSKQNEELQQTIANLQAQLSDKQCVLQSLAQCHCPPENMKNLKILRERGAVGGGAWSKGC